MRSRSALAVLTLTVLAAGCAGGATKSTSGSSPGGSSPGGSSTGAAPATDATAGWKTERVDVDGVTIALSCQGAGPKTVVFVSNLAEDGVTGWQSSTVPDTVAGNARVCTYDRPGLGASAVSTTPRSVAKQVVELNGLVEKKAITAPLVLVGHRYGTHIVRQFAQDHVREIAGMVLVDPPLEQLDPTAPPGLTAGQQAEYDSIPGLDTNLGAFGAGKLPPPPAPTIVLGAGDQPPLPNAIPVGGPRIATASPRRPAEAGEARRAGQQQLARKSPFGSFRAIDGTGSYIQFWQPAAVVDAIVTVLNDPRSPH